MKALKKAHSKELFFSRDTRSKRCPWLNINLASHKLCAVVYSGTSVCDRVIQAWALQCLKKGFQVPKTIRALFAKNHQSSLCPTHGDIESSRIGNETDDAILVAPHCGQQNHVTFESLKCATVAHHTDSHSPCVEGAG